MPVIREISALDAHPLRIAELRKGIDNPDVHYPQDDDQRSFHLGAFEDDALIAVASFSPAPFRDERRAWQLRGMAVTAEAQGRGVGTAMMEEAIARLRAGGSRILWCNARDTALGFYEKLGFILYGDSFVTADSGVPHHVMAYAL